MSTIVFRVHGTPGPQGSKRHVGNGVMIESSAKVKPWRAAVKAAAINAHAEVCNDHGAHFAKGVPVAVRVTFYLARPKGHYRTGRNSGLLRDAAPATPTTKPDVDKLLRSTLDALGEAGIYADDSQVIDVRVIKVYGFDFEPPGALIRIEGA